MSDVPVVDELALNNTACGIAAATMVLDYYIPQSGPIRKALNIKAAAKYVKQTAQGTDFEQLRQGVEDASRASDLGIGVPLTASYTATTQSTWFAFISPNGVAVDGPGNLYVADSGNHRIQKLSSTGQPLAQWGTQGSGPGQFMGPAGVAVDGQGNLYVADWGNRRIQKLSSTGQPLAQSDPGQFRWPYGVAVDGRGNLYVADPGGNNIEKLAP